MTLEHLWAGWRSEYVTGLVADESSGSRAAAEGSLFEQILASGEPDEVTHIVARGDRCFTILNRFPYVSGHVLVMPNRPIAELEDLTDDETAELWSMVRDAVVAIKAAYSCDGLNIGLNLGRAAGAGVPGHLHVHVMPRWSGDTNFMTSVTGTRVMSETLEVSWEKLREHWPR